MEQNYAPPPKKSNTGLIVTIVVLVLLCCCCVSIAAGWYLWTNGDQMFGLSYNLFNLLV